MSAFRFLGLAALIVVTAFSLRTWPLAWWSISLFVFMQLCLLSECKRSFHANASDAGKGKRS